MKLKAVSGIVLTVLLVGVLTLAFNVDGGYVLADAGWNIETVDSAGAVGLHTSIALDSGDNPHISYEDASNGDLKYAYYNGIKWNIETVDSAGAVGDYTSIALDGGDNPHISYTDWTNRDLKYAYYNGTNWNIETVDSAGTMGEYTSIALDSGYNPHISYYDNSNWDLKYAYHNGSTWNITTVDSAGVVGTSTSIALDSGYNPHISYQDYNNDYLKYAYYNGSWNIETVDSGVGGEDTSLALDGYDNPHISYYGNGDLKYAYYDGSWNTETVDSAGIAGYGNSIALDSGYNPHISYRDFGNEDLKYAYHNGSTWNITTVDSAGAVGSFVSIAIDSGDNPHISYWDRDNEDLKYAYYEPARAAFYIKLPNGGQWMNVTAAPPYDIGDTFNITVGIQNVVELTGYDVTIMWNATFCNATGNYWLSSFFHGEMMGGRWSAPLIEFWTNDLNWQPGPWMGMLPPLWGVFCGYNQTALGARYNVTGSFDIVTIEFRINAYGPLGFYIWKDPSNYAPWPYAGGQPYLQLEGLLPTALHLKTYSGWMNSAGHKPDYDVVWCPHPLFAPPTPLSGSVANAVLWIQPPSPYAPVATKTHAPTFPLVGQTVTFTVTQTKAGFDGAATHHITEVTIDYGVGPPNTNAFTPPSINFYHAYTSAGTYTVKVYCYAAGMPPGLEWCNLTQTIVISYVPPPVGGKATQINMPINKPELQIPWIWLSTIILPLVATAIYVKRKKKKH